MSNTLTQVIPQLLAQGLLALRQNAIMPLLVNRSYEVMAGEKGSVVEVPIPSAIAAQDVTPANTPPSTADVAPTKVNLALDKWKEAPFYLSDKDMMEAMSGTIPMQASEAVKALGNQVDNDIFALYKKVYGYAGVAGTTPFATDTTEARAARKTLNNQLAPMGDRRFVMDADAEANALGLRPFNDVNFAAGGMDIIEGKMTRKLGFAWQMDQNVPTHTAGSASGWLVNTTGAAVGDKTIIMDTGTGTFNVGDIVTFAGHAQTYCVTAATSTVLSFEPGLKAAPANNAAITVMASHVVNLAFHRDAIAFASRPLANALQGLGGAITSSEVDPISGLTLRLEVTREHKRTRFSYDILYGCELIRPELACRVAG